MALKEYRGKRDFKKTPEPSPEAIAAGTENRFFVQRHDASRLHYDFRLSIDGVLKSWAVPKGPSMNSSDKRLAVEVEDHPLAYGSFEGNIPKGEYGGGSVMLWDSGEFRTEGSTTPEEQWKAGDLKLHLEGTKLQGAFKLFRMRGKKNGNEWLLLKAEDAYADADWNLDHHASSVASSRTQSEIAKGSPSSATPAHAASPKFPAIAPAPMLATLVQKLPEGKEWMYEVKWDGVRALCTIANGKADLRSRNGRSYNSSFPELAELPDALRLKTGVVDGEIVAMDAEGRIHFQAIQPRLGAMYPGAKSGEAPAGISLYLFDLLFKDGKDLRSLPLEKRREILSKVLRPHERIKLSDELKGSAQAVMEVATENNLEGIVAKRWDSVYTSGRSRAWVKRKLQQRQEFVLCGWTSGKRSSFAALVLGLFEKEELRWSGNVGTGFSELSQKQISAMLKKSALAKKPAVASGEWPAGMHWVTPSLVAEIRFAEWTKGGRLRAPVFLGLRPDRSPNDCIRELPLRNLEAPAAAERQATDPASGNSPLGAAPKSTDLPLTNLHKVYFPELKITKGELLAYYEAVAPYLLPHLKDRPDVLKRYPDGIHGKHFFQKDLAASTPDWVPSVTIPSDGAKKELRYVLIQDLRVLLYVVNLGCIDHNPWMSRVKTLDSPDFVLFDLDPFQCAFDKVIEAAHLIHETLGKLKLACHVKTSGGNGLHVVVPLKPGHTYEEVQRFTAALATALSQARPDLFTIERSLSKRTPGRVYFDHVQIGRGKTISSVYSVRPGVSAPVSTPLPWEELVKGTLPKDFHMRNTLARLAKTGDLWEPMLRSRQTLSSALRVLKKLPLASAPPE